MNSIRPLITITILVVVGAFLYVKINEAPKRTTTATATPTATPSPTDVPPLASSAAAPTIAAPSSEPAAPAPMWNEQQPQPTTQAPAEIPAQAVAMETPQPAGMPAVPALPPMPTIDPQSDAIAPALASAPQIDPTQPPLPSTTSPIELPANIPVASYADSQPPAPGAPSPIANINATADQSAVPPLAATQPLTPGTIAAQPQVPTTPEQANNIDIAATGNNANALGQLNPLRETPNPTAADPGATGIEPVSAATVPPTTNATSFAASWPEIQATLDRGDFATAHQLLSRWYHDPSLTPTDAEMVETLLSQLAGTVIYSTEHQLEPPHVVKPGETLESIAKQYNVPWQLLAKINGLAASQVEPGKPLKVVRGPFSAVVDLGHKQLTLMVADRYAGRFPIVVPSVAGVSEGNWQVEQKLAAPTAGVVQSSYTPATSSVDRTIVLRGESAPGQPTTNTTLTISSAAAPDAAAAIRISAQDAEELTDILSIGSRVVIQK